MGTRQRVGLIGLGSIGLDLVELVRQRASNEIELIGAIVRDTDRTDRPLPSVSSARELLAMNPDVVVEVAGHEGLRDHGLEILRNGTDLLFVAVGALADPDIERALLQAASEGGQARVVSGAIGALDAIAGAAAGGLTRVTHTTRKPPRTIIGEDAGSRITEPQEVFRGNAREAALKFPESINVAAAVSFAGIGLDRTEVVILADPEVDRNLHSVEAVGEFGRLLFEIQNVPSTRNPKSGRLVAMSVLHQLRARVAPLSIG